MFGDMKSSPEGVQRGFGGWREKLVKGDQGKCPAEEHILSYPVMCEWREVGDVVRKIADLLPELRCCVDRADQSERRNGKEDKIDSEFSVWSLDGDTGRIPGEERTKSREERSCNQQTRGGVSVCV